VGTVELMLPPGVPPRSYLTDPVATAATFRGRWVRMADLGYLDTDGCLHLTARTKDVVHIGGRKVSCPEVEHVFEDFPGVREAAAFPFADRILGEELGVAVIADGQVSVDDLRRHAAARLSAHKVPTRIVLVDEFPRTGNGKVLKDRLTGLVAPAARTGAGGDVAAVLLDAVREVLGVPDATADRSLVELGASSVDAIRIYHRVTEAVGAEFDVALLFDAEPLAELAGRIDAAAGAGT
jgi:acyl carrier protein